jgi:hypothetical protein
LQQAPSSSAHGFPQFGKTAPAFTESRHARAHVLFVETRQIEFGTRLPRHLNARKKATHRLAVN